MNRALNLKLLLRACQGRFWAENNNKPDLISFTSILSLTGLRVLLLGLLLYPPLSIISIQNSGVAHAQFEVQNMESSKEQQFRDELDKWMLRAYEGDRDAQFKVGVLFTNDQFDQPDYEQAVYWYKQAARQGHVLAQYNLGHQYLTGVGVAKNDVTAMQWWLKAAEQDHSLAQFNIGRAYYLGIGLPMDHALSKYWFKRAAFNQEPKSIDILKQLGWYTEDMKSKPIAPPGSTTSIDEGNVVLQSPQAEPEPAEPSSKTFPSEESAIESRPALTSRITPVGEPISRSDESSTQSDVKVSSRPATSSATDSPSSAQTQPVVTAAGQPFTKEPARPNRPVALYTNPEVRSVLIAIIDERGTIEVVEYGDDWSIVQSTVGFPVWIHGDFVKVTNNIGKITGQAGAVRSWRCPASGGYRDGWCLSR